MTQQQYENKDIRLNEERITIDDSHIASIISSLDAELAQIRATPEYNHFKQSEVKATKDESLTSNVAELDEDKTR